LWATSTKDNVQKVIGVSSHDKHDTDRFRSLPSIKDNWLGTGFAQNLIACSKILKENLTIEA
jgi:hypothetical protein